MEDKTRHQSIRQSVLAAIREGRVEMRSKWYFALHAGLALAGIVLLLLIVVYVMSFTVFVLQQTGAWFVPVFGVAGWYAFFASVPWLPVLLALLFAFLAEIMVRHYAFAYRRPLIYSVAGIAAIAIAGSVVVIQAHVHRDLFRAAEQHRLPFGGGWYGGLGMRRMRNVHVGVISEVASPATAGFTMQNRRGETLQVIVVRETEFPFGIGLAEGDTVVVFGPRGDDTIRALGIRKVDSEFGPGMPLLNRHRSLMPFAPF